MNIHKDITAAILFITMASAAGAAGESGAAGKRVLLDKEGGSIEIRVAHTNDKQTRDAVRRQLQEEARTGPAAESPAMQQYQKNIRYRYENTAQGGRLRIIAKNQQALMAVQDFLRAQMNLAQQSGAVAFDFVANTALVVLPVMVNDHGPYRFLLDTGASNTILSTAVADALMIPARRSQMLSTAAGSVPVTVRSVNILQAGAARLEGIEIAVGNFGLLKTMNVDGILGSDYLRQFKVSIDYDNQLVDIEPCCSPISLKLNA
ncbi:MAG TPA: retropepsin-like aspartic protease [Terriglobia bacterium]|jgi:predicted aspartyl protease